MGALSHLRVLDLSRVLAGPWSGQILADLGADVIKVERPGSGDDTRAWGPPFLKGANGENTSEAAYYLSANRNKRSVTIDFTRPEGQRLVRYRHRELQGGWAGGLWAGLPEPQGRQSAAYLLLHHRFRADRALCPARWL